MRRAPTRVVPIRELYVGLYDGPHATPKPSDSGPVFLGIKNVTDEGRLDFTDIRHIAEDDYSVWTRRIEPKPGDLVFTYEATLNRYAIVPEGFRGCLGRRMALIRPDLAKVAPRYLHYYFFTEEWRAVISENTLSGATVDRIPLTNFPEFPVRVPSLAEQHRIADALSAYDDLIENNQRRIRILETMTLALYREWFVQFRFPGHEDASFVPSPIGHVPQGWAVLPVTDCVDVDPRISVSRDAELPFVPMGCLANDSMLIRDVQTRAGPTGSKFQNGDTLFARITPCLENGKIGFVQNLPGPRAVACGSTEFIVLRSRTLTPEYVYALARSEPFRDNAIKSMTGASGRQRVQDKCFESFLIVQPPRRLLDRFAAVVGPSFHLIHTLHMQSVNLRRTRDLLLPRLFSGRVSLGPKEAVA